MNMERYKTKIAKFLLLVYLPMVLMASFHVHSHNHCVGCHSDEENCTTLQIDWNDCPLCQFLQLVYDEAESDQYTVVLPEIIMDGEPYGFDITSSAYSLSLSRAPPFLL